MRVIHCTLLLQLLILADHYRSSTALRGEVNVVPSSNEDYTFVVAVQVKATGSVVCTGSLITKKHVLTTKHCLGSHQPAELEVVAGNYDRTKGIKYQIVVVRSFHQWHEDVISKTHLPLLPSDDIAILTLSKSVKGVKVAHLNHDSGWASKNIHNAEILGWGETDDSNQDSLRRDFVQVILPGLCKYNVLGNYPIRQITDDPKRYQICSLSHTERSRLSKGDEGGPMVVNGEVIGIALRPLVDDGILRVSEPNLHLDVSFYKVFIDSFVSSFVSDNDDDEAELCEL